MTCEFCQAGEAVTFEVDTADNVKLRLCEPRDRGRRKVSDAGEVQAKPAHYQSRKTAGENIIKLPTQWN